VTPIKKAAHGLRSTFRDWAGEVSHHPREVIEHALAHQLKDKAEAAYARGVMLAKRRALMADWARHCCPPKNGADVVPLRRAR
jgi:integrase